MTFKLVLKSSLAVLLFANSIAGFAAQENILCPEVATLKNNIHHVNIVEGDIVKGRHKVDPYFVGSDMDIFDDLSHREWALVTGVKAKDFEDAYTQSINKLNNMVNSDSEFADYFEPFYVCAYIDAEERYTAFAITLAESNDGLKKSKKNWKKIPKLQKLF